MAAFTARVQFQGKRDSIQAIRKRQVRPPQAKPGREPLSHKEHRDDHLRQMAAQAVIADSREALSLLIRLPLFFVRAADFQSVAPDEAQRNPG